MNVLLDGRVEPGRSGGVYQVVRSLAQELASRPDPTVNTILLARQGTELAECGLPVVFAPPRVGRAWRFVVGRVPGARFAHRAARMAAEAIDVPPVDLRAYDVVHLALQDGFASDVPTVFSPYDLQHEHLPEMFGTVDRRARRFRYKELARRANAVTVMNAWTANDVVEKLHVSDDRVFVVPPGVARPMLLDWLDEVAPVVPSFEVLPGASFALYPAQTWPHKNHLGLGRALAHLRASGLDVPVVCPGYKNREFRKIESGLTRLGVNDLLTFPGYVSDSDMEDLYRDARLLIFPSLFEGWGMPVFEAMARGLPVACSDVCGFRSSTDGAAMLFDPRRPAAVAAAIETMWVDEGVRARLGTAGLQVAGRYTWAESCARLRAIYKLVGGADLSTADEDALGRARFWQRDRAVE